MINAISAADIAHFQKEQKPGARVGKRSIMGSFEGEVHVHFFSNSWDPKRSHNSAHAHSCRSFPLFLKVAYCIILSSSQAIVN